jgi:intein-encoded DNA endonuclease-like protein
MIDVKLTEEEFKMVQYCIEFISANQRDFNEDGEKALKSIAEKFNAEYIEEANINYDFCENN